MPVLSNRARAACAARSIAETSAKEPLYSAIGGRTPATKTRSRSSIRCLPKFFRWRRGRDPVEAPAPAVNVHRRIDPGAEQDEDPAPFRVDPEAVACETGVTEGGGRERPASAAVEPSPPPAE